MPYRGRSKNQDINQNYRTEISFYSEIMQKLVNVCDKYWRKSEHRCYCQKYIVHAPKNIQQSPTCE